MNGFSADPGERRLRIEVSRLAAQQRFELPLQ